MKKRKEIVAKKQDYPSIMSADRSEKRDVVRAKKEKKKREELAKKLEEAILQICLNADYMQAIRNNASQYVAPDGTTWIGIVLIEGNFHGRRATLAVEPVNSQVNVYLRVGEGKYVYTLHWILNKGTNRFVSDANQRNLLECLELEELVGKTTPGLLIYKHGAHVFNKFLARFT